MRDIRQVVIHCSATPNGDTRFTAKDLDRMHRERGWLGVGYHYIIELDGKRVEGRPLERIGAHVEGANANSVGICMIGTDRFTVEQWNELEATIEELRAKFPWVSISGHRDYSPDKNGDGVIEPWEWFKTCPGFDVKSWLLANMNPWWNPKHVIDSVVPA
jgi:N-acetylmuramoyl-L-alanine amidase